MTDHGPAISRFGLDRLGLAPKAAHWNLDTAPLYEQALLRGEAQLAKDGPLVVDTRPHTGRSAADKFIVDNQASHDTVWWGPVNKPMAQEAFDGLFQRMVAHLNAREVFVQDLQGGAHADYRLNVRVITETAWHSLFARTMLVRPKRAGLEAFEPGFTVLHAPDFTADPAIDGTRSDTVIALDFLRRIILIGGTKYAGEIKKSVFSVLNFLLPAQGVMPMHCSANMSADGDVAVFFGLSGTGKTTLSADPDRMLIGDDEHGWADDGVFNFEGGCYAKMIRLNPVAEPQIFATTRRFGTVLENVVMDPSTRELDLDDAAIAENSRGAYPVQFIDNHCKANCGGVPKTIIMLTADAFGVLPPIAQLSPSQAMYHFLSGYTAKVAGTEIGVKEPQATFSTCFGAPFMPRHPSVYGNLLRDRIAAAGVWCWLINTGWTGGEYGVGRRMPIQETRTMLNAALSGRLDGAAMRKDPHFGFDVPVEVPGVDQTLLNPRGTWSDPAAYDAKARHLVSLFVENFRRFEDHVDAEVQAASPSAA
ncbi:MAG: phosphoenolpyruvate carboxykinase [Rhodothalassiaceae bacterium]